MWPVSELNRVAFGPNKNYRGMTMKAVQMTALGGPEVLELRDVPKPSLEHEWGLMPQCLVLSDLLSAIAFSPVPLAVSDGL